MTITGDKVRKTGKTQGKKSGKNTGQVKNQTRSYVRTTSQQESRDDYEIWLAYGDIHFNKHRIKHLNILYDLIADIQPDHIIDGGDSIDAVALSKHVNTSFDQEEVHREIESFRNHVNTMQKLAPNARFTLLNDNHFFRRLATTVAESSKLQALFEVDVHHWQGGYLDIWRFLGIDRTKWDFQDSVVWKDRMEFIHGHKSMGSSNNPVNRVRTVVRNHGMGVMRFHSHNFGLEVHKTGNREHLAIQMGGIVDPEKVGYIESDKFCNWTTSVGVLYMSKKDDTYLFVPVIFLNGKAVFNGKIYG